MIFQHDTTLPPELIEQQLRIEERARAYGLDYYPTLFELVDAEQLHGIAACGGFPVRYPHWRFGMEYEQLTKGYEYGLQKIYELVINNNPCYAYLLRGNAFADQKLVMAHVYGHADFFKNNAYFRFTNRKMMDVMANHGNRVRDYMERFGQDKVENFIDAVLSIDDLIDVHGLFIKRRAPRKQPGDDIGENDSGNSRRPVAKEYMVPFIHPSASGALNGEKENEAKEESLSPATPTAPERDVMLFILEHAPLPDWQLDILSMLRDEAYYFAPQAQTKIMNEGWASYWHSTIMTKHALDSSEVVHYCDHHSGTMASNPKRLNPYKLGLELFRDIEQRWNDGRFGAEYDACDDFRAKMEWNTHAQRGRQKIFEVRAIHNDVTFIDEFLTLEFVREHKLFTFGYNEAREQYEIESREFPKVKQQLLFALTNSGRPIIHVVDGNHANRGELYLRHQFAGAELNLDYAKETLVNLRRLWTRPVHIESTVNDGKVILSFDGREHSMSN